MNRKKTTVLTTLLTTLLFTFSYSQHIDIQDSIENLHNQVKENAYTDPDKALLLAETSLLLSKENNLIAEELQSYYSFGLAYYFKSFYSISNDYYRLITISPNSSEKQLSAAWNNMGINFEMLGQLDSALFAYQESKKIDHILGDAKSEHMSLINMGLLNGKLRRFDIGFAQLKKAEAYFEETNDLNNLGLCYMNLGYLYDQVGKIDTSRMNHEKAEEIYLKTKDYTNLFQTYLNLTNSWISLKNEKKANETFSLAGKTLPYIENAYNRATYMSFASLLNDRFGNNDSAIVYAQKSLRLYDSLGVIDRVRSEYYNLAGLYAETGQIDKYGLAISRYDSLTKDEISQDMNRRLAETEVRYKLDMKNLEVKNAESLLEKKRFQVIVTSVFSLALFLALLFTFRLYSRVNKANKSLYEKNVELMKQEVSSEQEYQSEKAESVQEENQLLKSFQKLLQDREFYKKPDLSLKMAAAELGTNEKYLSQAVNTSSDNFNTYVNRFRIKEARRIIIESNSQQLSLEELGLMVGFTNRHTFSRAFSQIAGISPSEFRKIHLSNSI